MAVVSVWVGELVVDKCVGCVVVVEVAGVMTAERMVVVPVVL